MMRIILSDGCQIPYTTIGNGCAGLQYLTDEEDIQEFSGYEMVDVKYTYQDISLGLRVVFDDKKHNTRSEVFLDNIKKIINN